MESFKPEIADSDLDTSMALEEKAKIEEVLSYYHVTAKVIGRDRNNKDPKERAKQANFSVAWFFEDLLNPKNPADLKPLLQAFLLNSKDASRNLFKDVPDKSALTFPENALLENDEGFSLNESQRDAVKLALNMPVSVIQGPPGTGKTETILNMISCILALPGNPTVAVVATNGKAIDNIADKIAEHGDDGANWQRLAANYARLGNRRSRDEYAATHPEAAKKDEKGKTAWNDGLKAADFLAGHRFITSTIHSLAKCFADGETYRYDYVIMDEASQCSVMLGLIPMNLAKHLVLVGDAKQLPPVYQEDLEPEIERATDGITAPEGVLSLTNDTESGKEGNSIIEAAEKAYAAFDNRVMLNEHYRCHPGIIQFCNEEFYSHRDEHGKVVCELDIKTELKNDESVEHAMSHPPIRVRWFNGNYCESLPPRKAAADKDEIEGEGEGGNDAVARLKTSKRNMRQLEIFMREEWPELKKRLDQKNPPSFCVLSPFRGQIETLKEMLEKDREDCKTACSSVSDDEGSDKTAIDGYILQNIDERGMTIHKSQGHEYDIVYFLPVDDMNWEWPWSQGGRLVNVAVSRAKSELVVITSTGLMSKETQQALVDSGSMPQECVTKSYNKGQGAQEEGEDKPKNLRYVEKLIDYVRRFGDDYFPAGSNGYGFVRSDVTSMFDTVPHLRQQGVRDDMATERACVDALSSVDLGKHGLSVVRDVRLSSLQPKHSWDETLGKDEAFPAADELKFINSGDGDTGSHFDFAIIDKDRRLVLAIEVDGAQHRGIWSKDGYGCKQAEKRAKKQIERYEARLNNDRMKDAIARDLGARVLQGNNEPAWSGEADELGRITTQPDNPTFTLLRLPTDGTTAWETDRLRGSVDTEGFRTIEDLIDEQMKSGTERAPKVTGGKSVSFDHGDTAKISALVKRWKQEDATFPLSTGAQANAALAKAGLIEKRGRDWLVTDAGRKLGIEQDEGDFDRGHALFCTYPASCQEAVKAVLLRSKR